MLHKNSHLQQKNIVSHYQSCPTILGWIRHKTLNLSSSFGVRKTRPVSLSNLECCHGSVIPYKELHFQ